MNRMKMMKKITERSICPCLLVILSAPAAAIAGDAPDASVGLTISNVWMMVATFLVFIMNLGFATLEAGLTRSKNTVNILFNNTLIPAIGLLTYAWFGFNLMYPGAFNGIIGFSGFGLPFPTTAGGAHRGGRAGHAGPKDYSPRTAAIIRSRFIRAMLSRLMPVGPALAHSPWFVQPPKPSASIWSTIAFTRL